MNRNSPMLPNNLVALPMDLRLILEKGQFCPAACDPTNVAYTVPKEYRRLNAFGRCLRCLTYFEVTPKAEVVNIRWGAEVPRNAQGEPIIGSFKYL